MKYSVAGLGKLGASMVAAIASRGHEVIGLDVNRRSVELLGSGRAPVQETDLEETIAANRSRIRATTSYQELVLQSDVTFVVVPTPSDTRGSFSLEYASDAFREIGRALALKDGFHNIVLTSTVLPGSTRYALLPILERESGKVCGRDFGLCYSPEFIALGSVIRDFLNPDFTLIGEFDERCGSQLERCYDEIVHQGTTTKRMSLENAELTKIAINTYVTTKITFANMIADLCERLPGGDVDVVSDALGADKRIGRRYLTGALGYGGPCFPRDNVALGFIARELGTRAALAESTDRVNRTLANDILVRLPLSIGRGTRAAVLGAAYKPFTHIADESQGVFLARGLAQLGADVRVFDPLANAAAAVLLGSEATVTATLDECIAEADVILVTTPDPHFQDLVMHDFSVRETVVVDFWRSLDVARLHAAGARVIHIGRSFDDDANAERLRQLWGGGVQPLELHEVIRVTQ